MVRRFGRNPDHFDEKYKETDNFILQKTIEEIKKGNSVILDYGFWNKKTRAKYYRWAKRLTPNVCFYAVCCDIDVAKKRVLERTRTNPNELFIDENCFNELLDQYEPITENEGYPVVFINQDNDLKKNFYIKK